MALSNKFFKRLGFTANQWKSKSQATQDKISHAIFQAADEDFSDGQQADSCCGVWELSGICRGRSFEAICKGLEDGYKCQVYYSIDRVIRDELVSYGFKRVASFVNPNTENEIDVLVLTV